MFERFTPAARDLVTGAQSQRSARRDDKVRTEHFLLALLIDDGPSGEVLRRQGLDVDRIIDRLDEHDLSPDATASENDDLLLKGLGIDVGAIRRSLDQTFGPGAFDRARHRRNKPARLGSSRRAGVPSSRFDPLSKRVLELSLREALRLKTKHIGPEHIGLGILQAGEGLACQLLSQEGVNPTELRASWEAIALGAPAH